MLIKPSSHPCHWSSPSIQRLPSHLIKVTHSTTPHRQIISTKIGRSLLSSHQQFDRVVACNESRFSLSSAAMCRSLNGIARPQDFTTLHPKVVQWKPLPPNQTASPVKCPWNFIARWPSDPSAEDQMALAHPDLTSVNSLHWAISTIHSLDLTIILPVHPNHPPAHAFHVL